MNEPRGSSKALHRFTRTPAQHQPLKPRSHLSFDNRGLGELQNQVHQKAAKVTGNSGVQIVNDSECMSESDMFAS